MHRTVHKSHTTLHSRYPITVALTYLRCLRFGRETRAIHPTVSLYNYRALVTCLTPPHKMATNQADLIMGLIRVVVRIHALLRLANSTKKSDAHEIDLPANLIYQHVPVCRHKLIALWTFSDWDLFPVWIEFI
jgi:hypothetical protein